MIDHGIDFALTVSYARCNQNATYFEGNYFATIGYVAIEVNKGSGLTHTC